MFISKNRPLFDLQLKRYLVKHRKISKYYEIDRRSTLLNVNSDETLFYLLTVNVHKVEVLTLLMICIHEFVF